MSWNKQQLYITYFVYRYKKHIFEEYLPSWQCSFLHTSVNIGPMSIPPLFHKFNTHYCHVCNIYTNMLWVGIIWKGERMNLILHSMSLVVYRIHTSSNC